MSKALVVMMAISTAAAVGGTIMQANAAADAAKLEQAQLEEQKELNKIQAMQEEAREKEKLQIALSTQAAQAASQNRSVGFGDDQSLEAIRRDTIYKSEQNVRNIKLLGASKARRFDIGISQKGLEARAARTEGYMKAASKVASFGVDTYKSGLFGQQNGGK